MFQKIKEFLFGKLPVEQTPSAPVEAVPYKVEPPVAPVELSTAPKCGCGRSPTGLCVGLHKLSDTEWAVHADNPAKAVPEAPAKKQPAARKTPAKKPAVIKAVPKTRAPQKPKAK